MSLDEAAILRARAERLAAPLLARDDDDDDESVWIAELRIGGELHGIALSSLRAVVPLRRVTPVHLSPPHIVGVLRFQGQTITALSLSSLLGGRGLLRDPAVLLVVDPGWGHLVALDCEQIPRATALGAKAVREAKERSAAPVVDVDAGGQRMQLINVDRLLDRRTAQRHG